MKQAINLTKCISGKYCIFLHSIQHTKLEMRLISDQNLIQITIKSLIY